MTAHNVLHFLPVRQCAIKIAAPAFEPCPEAAPCRPRREARASRGDEVEEGNGGWLTGKPKSEKDVMVPGPGGMVLIKAGVPVEDDAMQERLDERCGTGRVLRPRQI